MLLNRLTSTLREYVCQMSQRHHNHRASPTNSAKLYIIRYSTTQQSNNDAFFIILFYFKFTNTHTRSHLSHIVIVCGFVMRVAAAGSVLKRAINTMFSSFCNLNAFTRIFLHLFFSHCAFGKLRLLLRTLSTIYILI